MLFSIRANPYTSKHILIGNQEYGGNLNEAVNAHFIEGDRDMYGNINHKIVFSFPFNIFIRTYIILLHIRFTCLL